MNRILPDNHPGIDAATGADLLPGPLATGEFRLCPGHVRFPDPHFLHGGCEERGVIGIEDEAGGLGPDDGGTQLADEAALGAVGGNGVDAVIAANDAGPT